MTDDASGIGAAIAQALRHTGARVCIADINEQKATGYDAPNHDLFVRCDVSDATAVASVAHEIDTHFGRLEILIYNTGIASPTAAPDQIDVPYWDRVMQTNVNGMFYCVHETLPMLRRAGGGTIVNMSTAAIRRGGFPQRLPYATSKAAVLGFTATLAMDVGPDGIRVHAVMPGTVKGDRLDMVIQDKSAVSGVPAAIIRDQIDRATSLRTAVNADEIAALIVFLCSPSAKNMSGQIISVCGNFEGQCSADFAF